MTTSINHYWAICIHTIHVLSSLLHHIWRKGLMYGLCYLTQHYIRWTLSKALAKTPGTHQITVQQQTTQSLTVNVTNCQWVYSANRLIPGLIISITFPNSTLILFRIFSHFSDVIALTRTNEAPSVTSECQVLCPCSYFHRATTRWPRPTTASGSTSWSACDTQSHDCPTRVRPDTWTVHCAGHAQIAPTCRSNPTHMPHHVQLNQPLSCQPQ